MPPIALKPRRFSRVTTPAIARTVVLLVLAATAAVTSLPRRADTYSSRSNGCCWPASLPRHPPRLAPSVKVRTSRCRPELPISALTP